MRRTKIALILFNAGVFMVAATFLPRAAAYTSTGPITEFINSRIHWEIAWLITLATALLTSGMVLKKGRRSTG